MKNKLTEIIEGWKNVVFTDAEIELLSDERMKICNGCPHKEINLLNIDICGLCHCPLIAKTRSPESKCPESKWDSNN